MSISERARHPLEARSPFLSSLAALGLAAGLYSITANLFASVVAAVGTLTLVILFLSAGNLAERWSPLRIFLPALVTYNSLSIALSHSRTSRIEWFALALAVLGFGVGCLVALRREPHSSQARKKGPIRSVRRSGLNGGLLGLVCGTASLVYLGLVGRAGTVPVLAADPNVARTLFFPDGITSTIVVLGFQTTIIAVGAARALRIPMMGIGASLLLASWSSVALLTLGNRGLLVFPVLVITVLYLWQREFKPWKLLVGGASIVTAVSFLGFQRNLTSWGSTYVDDLARAGYGGNAAKFAPILDYLAGSSSTFSRSIELIPDIVGYQFGSQFFGPVLLHPSTDLWLKDQLGLSFAGFGLAVGFVNAFYIDWGLIGCLIGPALFGFGAQSIHSRASASEDPRWHVLYVYVLCRLLLSLYGHPFAYLYYILLPVALWMVLSREHVEKGRRIR